MTVNQSLDFISSSIEVFNSAVWFHVHTIHYKAAFVSVFLTGSNWVKVELMSSHENMKTHTQPHTHYCGMTYFLHTSSSCQIQKLDLVQRGLSRTLKKHHYRKKSGARVSQRGYRLLSNVVCGLRG